MILCRALSYEENTLTNLFSEENPQKYAMDRDTPTSSFTLMMVSQARLSTGPASEHDRRCGERQGKAGYRQGYVPPGP